ncbi:MAG: transposase [Bacteroidetes bacterium HGW-Bacteroidetes-17]|jgi:DNA invertase Pin-like site-specific DNA recombinase|nr:MAG: transposase [Bacteroidetes bacterium HGW-Bacteroidetes-17]
MRTLRYNRVSSITQNLDRQQQNNQSYTYVFEDKCSGTIPLFVRKYGVYLKEYVEQSKVDEISIHSIDRLARNLRDLLDVIEFFHLHGVSLYIENLGMRTLVEGKMNYTIKMMISVMGSFSEIENEIRKERQMEGIEIAKTLGKYKNRKQRGNESTMVFLQKHKKAVDLIEQGYKGSHVCKICNLNKNTISKIRRYIKPQLQTI